MASASGDLARRLADLVGAFPQLRVLVVGDVIADQFIYGEIARVSREAPVLILRYESTETVPGGAGNAAANVAALGASVSLVGLVGRDRPGRAALEELRRRGADVSRVARVRGHATPTKTRILAGLAHSLRQQVIRVDHEPALVLDGELDARLVAAVRDAAEKVDAVIVSDYGHGAVTPTVAEAAREAAERRGIPALVDSRFRLAEYAHFTAATPNESELETLAGAPIASLEGVVAAGRRVAERLGLEALLVTRGKAGMVVLERDSEPAAIPAVGDRDAIDVTGAGDTVIAAYALGLAAGASFVDAAHLANHAGGLVVMKRGTATVARDELLASVAAAQE